MHYIIAISLCLCSPGLAADWLQFRGDGSAVAVDANPPAKIDAKAIAWKAELPGRGLSGPVVVGKRVFLSASSGYNQDRLHVLCFDTSTGKKLWHRQFVANGRTASHPKMANATPTPCSDGKHIIATFSSNDVVCLDLDGRLKWYRGVTHDFPNASNSLGMSSSPVVADGVLVVQVESDAEAFTLGLDVATGKRKWRLKRPRKANWTSPSLFKLGDETLVLLQSSAGVQAVSIKTGKEAWNYKNGASTIPSSGVGGGLVFVPSNGLTALQPSNSVFKKVWAKRQLGPGTSSPVAVDGRVYVINRAGVMTSVNAKDGSVAWKLRLKGPFSATPIFAGGKFYCFNEKGLGQVVQVGRKSGKVLSSHDFEETILCTPAAAGDAVYVRSDKTLWKIAR